MGATFGGGSSQTLFGSSGATTFLTKSTTFVAVAFMVTSLALAYISSNRRNYESVTSTNAPIEKKVDIPSDVQTGSEDLPSPASN